MFRVMQTNQTANRLAEFISRFLGSAQERTRVVPNAVPVHATASQDLRLTSRQRRIRRMRGVNAPANMRSTWY